MWTVAMIVPRRQRLGDQAEAFQHLVGDAGALEQDEPGIGAHENAGPERQDDEGEDQHVPRPLHMGGGISDRVAQDQRHHRHDQRDAKGEREAAPVDVLAEDAAVVLQREAVVIDRLRHQPADGDNHQREDDDDRRRGEQEHEPLLAAPVAGGWVDGGHESILVMPGLAPGISCKRFPGPRQARPGNDVTRRGSLLLREGEPALLRRLAGG